MRTILFTIAVTLFSALSFAKPLIDASGIAESSNEVQPLLPGMKVENTCVQDLNKKSICTDKLFAEKPSVIVFYRGGWCPYCNAQLNRMKTIEADLKSLGYQILAVSPDSNKSVAEQQKREKLSYTMLTDNELALSKALGIAYFLDKKTEKRYRNKMGIPFQDINGTTRVSLPVPAVYIIDKNGEVKFQYVNPDFRARLDESLLLAAAKQAVN